MIGIWTCIWDLSLGNLIRDLTIYFLALSSIKVDNRWAFTTEITLVIVKLIFCIWFVFLFHVYIDQEKTRTLCKHYQVLEHWHYKGEKFIFYELYIL